MRIESLSRLYDSAAVQADNERARRVADSKAKRSLRDLKSKIMDTETTSEAVEVAVAALENEEPEVVLTAVVETLGGVVSALANEVADSKRVIDSLKKMQPSRKRTRKADAATRRALTSKIKDSESTEEAKEIAVAALSESDPESVVEVVIDVLAGVIDDLENESVE